MTEDSDEQRIADIISVSVEYAALKKVCKELEGPLRSGFNMMIDEDRYPKERSCSIWCALFGSLFDSMEFDGWVGKLKIRNVAGSANFPICKDPSSIPEPHFNAGGFIWNPSNTYESVTEFMKIHGKPPEYHAWSEVTTPRGNVFAVDFTTKYLAASIRGVDWSDNPHDSMSVTPEKYGVSSSGGDPQYKKYKVASDMNREITMEIFDGMGMNYMVMEENYED